MRNKELFEQKWGLDWKTFGANSQKIQKLGQLIKWEKHLVLGFLSERNNAKIREKLLGSSIMYQIKNKEVFLKKFDLEKEYGNVPAAILECLVFKVFQTKQSVIVMHKLNTVFDFVMPEDEESLNFYEQLIPGYKMKETFGVGNKEAREKKIFELFDEVVTRIPIDFFMNTVLKELVLIEKKHNKIK